MDSARFSAIVERYSGLRIAVLGDFCLDRYLEIDPAKAEVSIETGLPVHNVINVRAQPGAAGTIVGNLAALGVGTILPVGIVGDDGEGYELTHALESLAGVRLSHLVRTTHRRTFTYCKPLIIEANKACESVAVFKCDLAKRDLTTVHHKEKLMSGYANKTRRIPKFLDVQT